MNPRWEQQDAAAFVERMATIAPDVKVEVFNANNDTSVQHRQAEQALTQGAKVLVVIPIDGESSAIIADTAAEEGVPTDNTRAMLKHGTERAIEVLNAAGAKHILARNSDDVWWRAGWHQMGTCRMGNCHETSVVNGWGRCHDVKNLFIVDGSVFVTAGAVNPTSTIQALALYIGDRIKTNIGNLFD